MTQYKLNIDNVRALAESQNIPYYNTTKLYYKKFAYNLTLKHINIWHHAYRRYATKTEIADIRQLSWEYTARYNRFIDLLNRKDIEHRKRVEMNYNLYFDDPIVFKLALRILRDDILELQGPASEEHLAAMCNNRKIVVREQLWYKKYRFKISYRGTSEFQENIVPAIMEFKRNMSADEIKLSSNIYRVLEGPKVQTPPFNINSRWTFNRRSIQPWHTCSVYLDNEDNFVLYKMMVSGSPESEQEILLLSEL